MSHAKQKIFHLEIEGEHYYFGSPKAIFDVIGEERLKMKYLSFHSNIRIRPGDVYVNRRHGWIVRCNYLQQAKTNRGNRWEEYIQAGVDKLMAQADAAPAAEQPVVETPAPVVETPAPVAESVEQHVAQHIVEPVEQPIAPPVEQPVVETPAPEPAAEQPVAAKPKSRKKKNNDNNPQQLTLF